MEKTKQKLLDLWYYEATPEDLEEIKAMGEEKFWSSYYIQEKFMVQKRGSKFPVR